MLKHHESLGKSQSVMGDTASHPLEWQQEKQRTIWQELVRKTSGNSHILLVTVRNCKVHLGEKELCVPKTWNIKFLYDPEILFVGINPRKAKAFIYPKILPNVLISIIYSTPKVKTSIYLLTNLHNKMWQRQKGNAIQPCKDSKCWV